MLLSAHNTKAHQMQKPVRPFRDFRVSRFAFPLSRYQGLLVSQFAEPSFPISRLPGLFAAFPLSRFA